MRPEILIRCQESPKDTSDAPRPCFGSRSGKAPTGALKTCPISRHEQRPDICQKLSCPWRPCPAIHLEIREEMEVAALEWPPMVSDRRNDTKATIADNRSHARSQGFWNGGKGGIPPLTILMAVSDDERRHDSPIAHHWTHEEKIDGGLVSTNPIPNGIGNRDERSIGWQAIMPGCTV